jgi:hypothetical protein
MEEVAANLKRKLAQAFTKFEYFFGFFPPSYHLLPKGVMVELMKTSWLLNFH